MRMGRPNKKRRGTAKNVGGAGGRPVGAKPGRSSPNMVVGQVSSNVVASMFSPVLTDMAEQSLERHADELLRYRDALRNWEEGRAQQAKEGAAAGVEEGAEAEVDLDGGTTTNVVDDGDEDHGVGGTTKPSPPSSNLLFGSQHAVDEFASTVLQDTAYHFSIKTNKWKVHVNAAKFERLLDERYGPFRPLITEHPEIEQFVRYVQRRYAMGHFSPFRQGDPPLNKSTSVVLLFMLHRNNIRWEGLTLAAVFLLVGLQPWALVTLVALGRHLLLRRKASRVGGMPREVRAVEPYYARDETDHDDDDDEDEVVETKKKYQFLETAVGTKICDSDFVVHDGKGEGDDDETEDQYDVLILGSGPAALYGAALLARAGKKTMVLCAEEDASGCAVLSGGNGRGGGNGKRAGSSSSPFGPSVPFDVHGTDVSHCSRQQRLLAPALCTTTDVQGGVRFARVGTEADGFAHTVLSIPGVGLDGPSSRSVPVVLNAGGGTSIAEYAAAYLGDGWPSASGGGGSAAGGDNSSSTMAYLSACTAINDTASQFYLSKVIPEEINSSRSSTSYQSASIRYASSFLSRCLPLNVHVRSLMAGIGMAGENLSPSRTSMGAHVTNVCALTGPEGLCYPVGGARSLCHALASVVEQCGGRVVTDVSLKELVFEEEKGDRSKKDKKKKSNKATEVSDKGDDGPKPRCVGVLLADGRTVKVSPDNGAVISTLGFITTFVHLLPENIRAAHGVPRGLPALSERRPLLKILIGLQGTKDELNVTGADWYRLPNATLARDEMDPVTGQVKFGEIGVDGESDVSTQDEDSITEQKEEEKTDIEATSGTEENGRATGGRGKRSKQSTVKPTAGAKKSRRAKFVSGASWMKISFPSAKDPSWTEVNGKITTCVVTVEADDDFVRMFDTKPKVYSMIKFGAGEAGRLMDRVMKDLVDIFPQLEGKVGCAEVRGPYRAGLSHNPERYAAKGIRPDTPYPGLYIGGADLTVGDSFSGSMVGAWLAANAVMDYSFIDHLFLEKNITTDLQLFTDEPCMIKERKGIPVDDIAVPVKEPAPSGGSSVSKDAELSEEREDAKKSKEK